MKTKIKKNNFDKAKDLSEFYTVFDDIMKQFWDKKDSEINFKNMNQAQKVLYCSIVIPPLIDNGAFLGFFENRGLYYHQEGIKYLNIIGDKESSIIFDEACKIYDKYKKRINKNKKFSEMNKKEDKRMRELDDKFWALDKSREELTLIYLKKHTKELVREA